MAFKPKYLVLIPISLAAFIAAFFYCEHYEGFVRCLYVVFTDKHIYFIKQKFFRFASLPIMASFSIFCAWLSFLIIKKPSDRDLLNVFIAIATFFVTTTVIAFFNSNGEITACTACNDGRKQLSYGSINYDLMFVISLVMAGAFYTLLKFGWRNKI